MKHVKEAMFDNVEQNLIEIMADFLDSDSLELDCAIAEVKDPIDREKSELHMRMAKAAFSEFKKTVEIIKKHEDTWYLFEDGTIGALVVEDNEYLIASGEPGNYTAYDHNISPIHTAVEIGLTKALPTLEAAQAEVKKKQWLN